MKRQATRFPRSGEHGVGGELGPGVRDDEARLAASRDDGGQLTRHAAPGNRGVGDRAETFLGHVVDDVVDAKATTGSELIVNEIDRPPGVGCRPGSVVVGRAPEPPLKLDFEGLLAAGALQRRNANLILRRQIDGDGVLIEFARLELLDP